MEIPAHIFTGPVFTGQLFMSLRLTTNNQNGGPAPAPRRLASLVVFIFFNDLAFYFGGRFLSRHGLLMT